MKRGFLIIARKCVFDIKYSTISEEPEISDASTSITVIQFSWYKYVYTNDTKTNKNLRNVATLQASTYLYHTLNGSEYFIQNTNILNVMTSLRQNISITFPRI